MLRTKRTAVIERQGVAKVKRAILSFSKNDDASFYANR